VTDTTSEDSVLRAEYGEAEHEEADERDLTRREGELLGLGRFDTERPEPEARDQYAAAGVDET
jgi:hypothetical protein